MVVVERLRWGLRVGVGVGERRGKVGERGRGMQQWAFYIYVYIHMSASQPASQAYRDQASHKEKSIGLLKAKHCCSSAALFP